MPTVKTDASLPSTECDEPWLHSGSCKVSLGFAETFSERSCNYKLFLWLLYAYSFKYNKWFLCLVFFNKCHSHTLRGYSKVENFILFLYRSIYVLTVIIQPKFHCFGSKFKVRLCLRVLIPQIAIQLEHNFGVNCDSNIISDISALRLIMYVISVTLLLVIVWYRRLYSCSYLQKKTVFIN